MKSLAQSGWIINRRAIAKPGVLIVEDDVAILRASQEGLGKLGFQVTGANRAADGIRLPGSAHTSH